MREYASADEMFEGMLKAVLHRGRVSHARNGKKTLDLVGWQGSLINPRKRLVCNPARGVRPGYPAASVAWNLAERTDAKSICWWNPRGLAISDDGLTFHGADYGHRMTHYLDEALELLRLHDGTRRAWVPIWRPEDLVEEVGRGVALLYSREGKDVPCTLGFGLRLWELQPGVNELEMNVVMRSQSAWGVFPYDVYLMSALQELIANELGAYLGALNWSCPHSLHIFEEEIVPVAAALRQGHFEHVEDGAITVSLGEARRAYPVIFDRIITGVGETYPELPVPWSRLVYDPIRQQMSDGGKLIRGRENA